MTRFICLLLMYSTFLIVEISSQNSVVNITIAKELAATENKNVLMVFSGSDWCKPCIQLKREILDADLFKEYQSRHLVHLELDFPYQKKNQLSEKQLEHNEVLAEKYNAGGAFPKVLIINKSELVLGVLNYKKGMTPDQFVAELEKIKNDRK